MFQVCYFIRNEICGGNYECVIEFIVCSHDKISSNEFMKYELKTL